MPLIDLCKKGHLFEVQQWVADGKPVNLPYDDPKCRRLLSPLEIATDMGFHSLAAVLLDGGAIQEPEGWGLPIYKAIRQKRRDLIELLVDHGQDVAEVEAPAPSFARSSFQAAGVAHHAAKERELLERTDISGKGKKSLLAVLRMEKIAQSASSPTTQSYTWKVDNKGIVAFMLPGGGVVRDTGQEILFSVGNAEAAEMARLYGQAKWGKHICIEANCVSREAIAPQHQLAR